MIPEETKNFPILTDLFGLADHDVICKMTFCRKKSVQFFIYRSILYERSCKYGKQWSNVLNDMNKLGVLSFQCWMWNTKYQRIHTHIMMLLEKASSTLNRHLAFSISWGTDTLPSRAISEASRELPSLSGARRSKVCTIHCIISEWREDTYNARTILITIFK